MSIVGWVLAAVFAVLALYFALRRRGDMHAEAVDRLTDEVEVGSQVGDSAPGDPPEVLQLRLALARGWRPLKRSKEDPGEEALRGLFRFVRGAVLGPLEEGLEKGQLRAPVEGTVNALRDLGFFARGDREEARRTADLLTLVQAATREYALQAGVPVRFNGPPGAIPVEIQTEGFKNALYLLLVNAGRFGGGQIVDVVAEADGEDVRLLVRDRGTGFTDEALDRGCDPFWSTDADALGLGLTHARRVVEAQGGRLSLSNREQGGAEVAIVLRRSR